MTIEFAEGAALTLTETATPTGDQTNFEPYSFGLINNGNGSLTVTGKGTLNAAGGSGCWGSSGIYSGDGAMGNPEDGAQYHGPLSFRDGVTVSAAGGDCGGWSIGICAANGADIRNATVTASSGKAGELSCGLMNTSSNVPINVTDGTVTAKAGNATNSLGVSGSLTVTGGKVEAAGYVSAIGAAPTLNQAAVAAGSASYDGGNAEKYDPTKNAGYHWFQLPTQFYSVTIHPGADMTQTADTALDVLVGQAMTAQTYRAAQDYYFPTDYASKLTLPAGFTVTRGDTGYDITVTGTPTADTTITLAAATAKTKEPTPNAGFAGTPGDPDKGTLTGLVAGEEYSLENMTPGVFTADSNGEYSILDGLTGMTRLKLVKLGSGFVLDSDAQTIDLVTVSFDLAGGSAAQGKENEVKTRKAVKGSYTLPAAPEKEGYAFLGWQAASGAEPQQPGGSFALTGDVTFTATWEILKFTVKFLDEDGTELQSSEVAYGETPEYTGKTPTKEATAQESYSFAGWDKAIADVTGDAEYRATYTPAAQRYSVTFLDEDGTVLKAAAAYDYGTLAADIVKPADPTKEKTAQYTYTFAGWTPELSDVTADAAYKATYKEAARKYKVTFDPGKGGGAPVEKTA